LSKIEYKHIFYLIFIAIALRFIFAAFYTFSGDACWHLSAARFFSEYGRLPLFERIGRNMPFWTPPLFHILAGLIMKLFSFAGKNISDFLVKMLSPLLNAFGIYYAFKLYKKLRLNKAMIFFSMLFFCLTPMSLYLGYLPYLDAIVASILVISIFFFVDGRYLLSGIFFGLSNLTKYNAAPMAPLFLWLIYIKLFRQREHGWLTKSLCFILPAGVLGLFIYVRNFLLFSNPVFITAAPVANLSGFFDPKTYFTLYLGLLSVPASHSTNLEIVTHYSLSLLVIWFILSTLYFLPMLYGFFRFRYIDQKRFIIAGLFGYILFFIFVLFYRASEIRLRYFLPMFIFLSIIWAQGITSIFSFVKRNRIFRSAVLAVLFVCVAMFILQEPVKLYIGHKSWESYDAVFSWADKNIPKNATVLELDDLNQCLSYHLFDRTLIWEFEPEKIAAADPLYIWDGWGKMSSSGYGALYQDQVSGIQIYKVKGSDIKIDDVS